ncbi:MAG: indole-3-glycerol phosphate synthase TrpC [Candidatus Margulisiibacteriota bacterium]
MILDDIIFDKRREVAALKIKLRHIDFKKLIKKTSPAKDFLSAISKPMSLIAEVKKASPSAGVIKEDFDPVKTAREYEKAGAGAISVLTDRKYFKGSIKDLKKVVKAVSIPVLRKDFIIDEDQIYEARMNGADAILLIASILDDARLSEFIKITRNLGMRAVVEVHSEEEMERALKTPAKIIGINNRDLKTFKVDLQTTVRIAAMAPKNRKVTLISESGIKTAADVLLVKGAGVSAILVGEELVKQKDIPGKIRELRLWEGN